MRLIFAAFLLIFISTNVFAQGMMWRWGENKRCPLCGEDWDGGYPYYKAVPDQIDRPKNEKWLDLLSEVLSDEELSKKQYDADRKKYNANMPYRMVIPQEENHIIWIKELFDAYGVKPNIRALPVQKSDNLREAYENAMKLEEDLIPKYERLIENAEDKVAQEVLGNILLQTRMHYVMFSHALNMGGMMQMNPMRFKRRAY